MPNDGLGESMNPGFSGLRGVDSEGDGSEDEGASELAWNGAIPLQKLDVEHLVQARGCGKRLSWNTSVSLWLIFSDRLSLRRFFLEKRAAPKVRQVERGVPAFRAPS